MLGLLSRFSQHHLNPFWSKHKSRNVASLLRISLVIDDFGVSDLDRCCSRGCLSWLSAHIGYLFNGDWFLGLCRRVSVSVDYFNPVQIWLEMTFYLLWLQQFVGCFWYRVGGHIHHCSLRDVSSLFLACDVLLIIFLHCGFGFRVELIGLCLMCIWLFSTWIHPLDLCLVVFLCHLCRMFNVVMPFWVAPYTFCVIDGSDFVLGAFYTISLF
jgi:hypothetical protein